MPSIISFAGGVVIMRPETAQNLAQAVVASREAMARQGKQLNPRVLNSAIEILSARGTTEPAQPAIEHTHEYEHINTHEAAAILGCSPRHMRKLATDERIPGFKRNGSWYFTRDDVETYQQYR